MSSESPLPALPPEGASPEDLRRYENALLEAFRGMKDLLPDREEYFDLRVSEFRALRGILASRLAVRFDHCLEIGCAFGLRGYMLLPFCARVTGTDIEAAYFHDQPAGFRNAIEVARHIATERLPEGRLDFQYAEPTALPFAAGEFDLVYSDYVLEHIPDLPAAMRELARVTRAGGTMIHTVPVAMSHVLAFLDWNTRFSDREIAWIRWKDRVKRVLRKFGIRRYRESLPNLRWNRWLIPPRHSEFIPDYDLMAQCKVYELENYLRPMIAAGFEITDVVQTREHNRVVVARRLGP